MKVEMEYALQSMTPKQIEWNKYELRVGRLGILKNE